MDILKVVKYLIAGVVIGAILFFAGFGVINMLSDPPEIIATQTPKSKPSATSETTGVAQIAAPSIAVNSTATTQSTEQGTRASPIKIKPLESDAEATTETQQASPQVAFGTLTLSTVNAMNGQAIASNFMIENGDNVAIASVKETASTTLSLPVGNYKIIVTQGTVRVVRFLGVKDGQNGSEVFELDIPVLAEGVTPAPAVSAEAAAQVSATSANTDEPSLARENVQADGTDRPAVEATTEVTVPATAESTGKAMGGLRVSALTKVGNRPMNASFYIQQLNGVNVENVKGVSSQQFNLPAGQYRVTARTGAVRVVKEITVTSNRGIHEVFQIPAAPETTAASPSNTVQKPATTTNASTTTQKPATTTNISTSSQKPAAIVTAVSVVKTPKPKTPSATPATPRPVPAVQKPVRPAATAQVTTIQPKAASKPEAAEGKTGRLELFSQTASNNKAIKSNFYIQTMAGKLVANKTYVNSIGYKLPAGKYRVTVRSTGYKDQVVEMFVREGQLRREVFKMKVHSQAPAIPLPTPVPATPSAVINKIPATTAVTNNRASRRGGLQINIISAETRQGLIADISVHRPNGREVRRQNQTSMAQFNLPPREFVVRVNYGGLVTNQKVRIRQGKLAIKTIAFN